jgi:hypothetical protein
MRRSFLTLAITAAVTFGAAAPALADETIVGELICNACYTTRGADRGSGEKHVTCARTCAQKGHRLAVVTAAGVVYVVTGSLAQDNNAKLVALIGKTVAMRGKVREETVVPGEENSGPGGSNGNGNGTGNGEGNGNGNSGKNDNRRGGYKEGEVIARTRRSGDFREGDVRAGIVKIIEADRVDLAAPAPVQ